MNKVINIRNKRTIDKIAEFKLKKYENCDIRFENIYLKQLNKLLDRNLFCKNDLFINSYTLWELMQSVGSSGSHNYHGLTPEDVYYTLNELADPLYILQAKNERILIVPDYLSTFDELLVVVIEKDAGLIINKNAKINKIVTMYPKSDLRDTISKAEEDGTLLYKKMSINTGSNCLN